MLFSRFKQRVDRLRMHGAEHQRGRGAVLQQLLHKKLRNFLRIGRIGKLHFSRKGIGVEPFQQLFAVSADHLGLRKMNMGVDKARNNQLVWIMRDLHAGQQMRLSALPVAEPCDFAVLGNQQAVFDIAHLAVNFMRLGNRILNIQEAAADRGRCIVGRHWEPAAVNFFG